MTDLFNEIYYVLNESSFYILIGFFFAGIVHYLIPTGSVVKHLGRNRLKSVINASLLGIPLPLCSCSVIPMAFGLKRSGASKSSVISFLVSTPETGVDSIFITYALMGPVVMVARPIAAFFTALFAGMMEMLFGGGKGAAIDESAKDCADCCDTAATERRSLKGSMSYAFRDLFKDIYLMLILGIVIAGIISFFVPKELFTMYLDSTFLSMLVMLAVSVPVYVCATASTPIAMALMMKGLSPGAAVVFLLAGPATNMLTLTVLTKNMGKRSMVLYLVSIVICSIFFGYAINYTYSLFSLDVYTTSFSGKELIPDPVKTISGIILVVFSIYTFIRHKITKSK